MKAVILVEYDHRREDSLLPSVAKANSKELIADRNSLLILSNEFGLYLRSCCMPRPRLHTFGRWLSPRNSGGGGVLGEMGVDGKFVFDERLNQAAPIAVDRSVDS